MTSKDFEQELKALDPRIEVIPNPNRPGLSNIKILGRDICPIPTGEIYDEPNNDYRYEFPNGMSARHKSKSEALVQVQTILELIKTPEGHDSFFATD